MGRAPPQRRLSPPTARRSPLASNSRSSGRCPTFSDAGAPPPLGKGAPPCRQRSGAAVSTGRLPYTARYGRAFRRYSGRERKTEDWISLPKLMDAAFEVSPACSASNCAAVHPCQQLAPRVLVNRASFCTTQGRPRRVCPVIAAHPEPRLANAVSSLTRLIIASRLGICEPRRQRRVRLLRPLPQTVSHHSIRSPSLPCRNWPSTALTKDAQTFSQSFDMRGGKNLLQPFGWNACGHQQGVATTESGADAPGDLF